MHERVAVTTAELDDLDQGALERHTTARAPGMTREDAAIRLGLLTKAAGRSVPTIAGLYTFGKAPQLIVPEWGLSAVAVAGPSLLGSIGDRADLEGPLPALVEGGLAFVRKHTTASGERDDGEYPEAAVREALVNALVHRELRKASRVALRVFSDRLEIWSPGGAPEPGLDLEELAREGGVSQPRNPIVASTARALGIGEQIGRGLLVIAAAGRVEITTSPRDVLVTLASRWSTSSALS